MDPSKVDGLAQVLETVAEFRQVVVFTHDTRLTEAIRRLRIRATILEMARKERSEVEAEYADEATARRASGAWAALSAACHYHSYESNPTAGELRTLHDEVRVLAERLSPVPLSS
ncbi:hypothetical protein [Streptosporangium roseum]|uniref:hypothetical protein n=1 Tax=Streptosporangium roseum TaxID=2001 RepID=UPI0004CCF65A|nr:hypothetical protein [Streptosporangium roseum]